MHEMETRWVYFGNLNWFRPACDVEVCIRKLFVSNIKHIDPAFGDKKWADFVECVEIGLFAPSEKLKPRDLAKLHQGFALIRFSQCEIAKLAVSEFVGIELPDGTGLGPLRVALSRAKVRARASLVPRMLILHKMHVPAAKIWNIPRQIEMEPEREAAQRTALEKQNSERQIREQEQRAHNSRQRRRQRERCWPCSSWNFSVNGIAPRVSPCICSFWGDSPAVDATTR